MAAPHFDRFLARTGPLDLHGIDWHAFRELPLSPRALESLQCMQYIESHTAVFPRTIFSRRALNDPAIGTFLICWLYEETLHGHAIARLLEAAGSTANPYRGMSLKDRIEGAVTSLVAGIWPGFLTLHMTWGAIHELTTITAYQRFARLERHPVLVELLARIVRDESRHFGFYFHEARERLQHRATARTVRTLVDRLWAPVGHGVVADEDHRALIRYLYSGPEGRAALQKVDDTIRRLPGFEDAPLLEAWVDREVFSRETGSDLN